MQAAYMQEEWFKKLKEVIQASNITQVAKKLGVARQTLGLLYNGSGAYGAGLCSTESMRIRFTRAYLNVDCPHLNKEVGFEVCQSICFKPAPTHNPLKMAHYRACQGCPHKPYQAPNLKKENAS